MRKIKFSVGNIYHIYNRGVEKRDIFGDDNDKWRFLQGLFLFNDEKSTANLLWQLERRRGAVTFGVLKEFSGDIKKDPLVRILADCLMPNHFHLLLEETKEGGISKFMHKLGIGTTEFFNNKYNRVGGLYQGTFKAALVDSEEYLKNVLVYINVINPGQLIEPNLKEEGVKDIESVMNFASNYQWSTNLEYLGKRDSIIIEKGLLGEVFPTPEIYAQIAKSVLLERKFDRVAHLTLE
jgi:putative transposase